MGETPYLHDIIRFRSYSDNGISEKIVELYKKGLATTDIAKQFGRAASTINSILHKAGVEIRSKSHRPFAQTYRTVGKTAVRPPYGFCYFQGQIVPDQREYENLLLIYNLWVEGSDAGSIKKHLNDKKIPPRSAQQWSRDSIKLILKRFQEKLIIYQGGKLELR